MDPFKKFPINTIDEIEREFGRMLRNMSTHRMFPFRAENLFIATDVYETVNEYILFMEIPGVDPDKLSVLVNQSSVTVSGERLRPDFDHTICIHQLEVEYGKFQRTISLAAPIDGEASTSSCKNGFLLIRLPKKKIPSPVQVTIKGE
ncbi:MAG: Hsp20/alpha crystallin family protein [Proteobacteria bacterium]|nr:Hsp20/alpha crystallin family protein [Pseudomonadota bacterium]MBU4294269.1 Hsp20/alpha crystallin family protein [Pseudomonadota bacterium]MCG2747426.1 Hsp20/alpha crystallin family protein [Desulfobulbaceae bacterium]